MEPSGAQFREWETPPCSSSEPKAPEAEVWLSLFLSIAWAPVEGGLGAPLVPPVLPDCSARLQRPLCPVTLSQATWPSVRPPHVSPSRAWPPSYTLPATAPCPPVPRSFSGERMRTCGPFPVVASPCSLFTPPWPEFLTTVCISVPPSPLQFDSSLKTSETCLAQVPSDLRRTKVRSYISDTVMMMKITAGIYRTLRGHIQPRPS